MLLFICSLFFFGLFIINDKLGGRFYHSIGKWIIVAKTIQFESHDLHSHKNVNDTRVQIGFFLLFAFRILFYQLYIGLNICTSTIKLQDSWIRHEKHMSFHFWVSKLEYQHMAFINTPFWCFTRILNYWMHVSKTVLLSWFRCM